MTTKKDLVEAYAFSRRRLVAAFLSGAPGGREVEPPRPGRAIVGGIALTVLLLAGGAIAGVFSPRPDADWNEPGLVRSEADGQNYVILDYDEGEEPELRPVVNFVSAQLIFGFDVEATEVPENLITSERRGPLIGILGAPSPLPTEDDLLDEGWTACTDSGSGVRLTVQSDPVADPTPNEGLVVTSGGDTYLIAEAEDTRPPSDAPTAPRRAYAYPLGRNADAVVTAVVQPSPATLEVPAGWLRLFPTGGQLDTSSIDLPGAGDPYTGPGADQLPSGAEIGDYYDVGEQTLLLTPEGTAPLTPFALEVYRTTARTNPTELTVDTAPDIPGGANPYADAVWPTDILTSSGAAEVCAVLDASGTLPAVELGQLPPVTELEPVDPNIVDITVESGRGAFVRSGGFDASNGGQATLIDDRGLVFPVVGADAIENLGFDLTTAPLVPQSWISLFDPGVTLTVDEARCPPTRRPGERTCEEE